MHSGLTNTKFNTVLDEVIRSLFMPDSGGNTIVNPNFYVNTTLGFSEWDNIHLESVNLDPSIFCCQYDNVPAPIIGMNIATLILI